MAQAEHGRVIGKTPAGRRLPDEHFFLFCHPKKAVQAELTELEATERVLARYSKGTQPSQNLVKETHQRNAQSFHSLGCTLPSVEQLEVSLSARPQQLGGIRRSLPCLLRN